MEAARRDDFEEVPRFSLRPSARTRREVFARAARIAPVILPRGTAPPGAAALEVLAVVPGSGLRPGDRLCVDPRCSAIEAEGVYLLALDGRQVLRKAAPCCERGGVLLAPVCLLEPLAPMVGAEHLPAPQLARVQVLARVFGIHRALAWPTCGAG